MMGQVVTDSELNLYWPFLDTDKDGLLSKQELANLVDSAQTAQFPSVSLLSKRQKELAALDNYFRLYDTNRNNKFSRKEIRSAAEKMGLTYGKEQVDLFNAWDTNKDGELSY